MFMPTHLKKIGLKEHGNIHEGFPSSKEHLCLPPCIVQIQIKTFMKTGTYSLLQRGVKMPFYSIHK
jgi:hypothetical protein